MYMLAENHIHEEMSTLLMKLPPPPNLCIKVCPIIRCTSQFGDRPWTDQQQWILASPIAFCLFDGKRVDVLEGRFLPARPRIPHLFPTRPTRWTRQIWIIGKNVR